MPRIDKYEPLTGGFRARLGFAVSGGDINALIAVGLNASGRVVKGAGNTGVVGVVNPNRAMNVGDVIDVMQDGEVVDMASLTAGTRYYADGTTGALNTTNTNKAVGWTVEADRLVVRIGK